MRDLRYFESKGSFDLSIMSFDISEIEVECLVLQILHLILFEVGEVVFVDSVFDDNHFLWFVIFSFFVIIRSHSYGL